MEVSCGRRETRSWGHSALPRRPNPRPWARISSKFKSWGLPLYVEACTRLPPDLINFNLVRPFIVTTCLKGPSGVTKSVPGRNGSAPPPGTVAPPGTGGCPLLRRRRTVLYRNPDTDPHLQSETGSLLGKGKGNKEVHLLGVLGLPLAGRPPSVYRAEGEPPPVPRRKKGVLSSLPFPFVPATAPT